MWEKHRERENSKPSLCSSLKSAAKLKLKLAAKYRGNKETRVQDLCLFAAAFNCI